MDIEDIKKKRSELEAKIHQLLLDFESETNCMPIRVSLDIVNTTTIPNIHKSILNTVTVDIEI